MKRKSRASPSEGPASNLKTNLSPLSVKEKIAEHQRKNKSKRRFKMLF